MFRLFAKTTKTTFMLATNAMEKNKSIKKSLKRYCLIQLTDFYFFTQIIVLFCLQNAVYDTLSTVQLIKKLKTNKK